MKLPIDPLAAFDQVLQSLDEAENATARHDALQPHAQDIADNFKVLRQSLLESKERLKNVMEGVAKDRPTTIFDPETASRVQALHAEASKSAEQFAAQQARLPLTPPLPEMTLLEAGQLGRLLLTELDLLSPHPHEEDDPGSLWRYMNTPPSPPARTAAPRSRPAQQAPSSDDPDSSLWPFINYESTEKPESD